MTIRQKWEYHVVDVETRMLADEHGEVLKTALNYLGRYGWELAALLPNGRAVFKRLKK